MLRFMLRSVLILAAFSAVLLLGQPRRDRVEEWRYEGEYRWERSWNDRPFPAAGACFFRDYNFQGDRFCVRRGDRLPHLPLEFGDNISSIRLFGGARVVVYNDRDFRNGSEEFRGSINDLRTRRFRDGHTWNDRISSVVVR